MNTPKDYMSGKEISDKITGKKLSSYQKNKQKYENQIKKLTDDIHILVKQKDSMEAIKVMALWDFRFDTEDVFLSGSRPLQEFSINFIEQCLVENGIISEMDKLIGDSAKATGDYMKGDSWEKKEEPLKSEDISMVYLEPEITPTIKD